MHVPVKEEPSDRWRDGGFNLIRNYSTMFPDYHRTGILSMVNLLILGGAR